MSLFPAEQGISNLLLDIGDTLVKIDEPFEIYTKRGFGFIYDGLNTQLDTDRETFIENLYDYRKAFRIAVKVDLVERSFSEFLSEALLHHFNCELADSELLSAEDLFIKSELSITEIMPDAISFLDRARASGMKILAATNNFSSMHVNRLFEQFGLQNYFDAIYISADLRCRKPAKGFLDQICKIEQLKHSTCLMIGDKIHMDILAANRSNIASCLIERRAYSEEERASGKADFVLQTLDQISFDT